MPLFLLTYWKPLAIAALGAIIFGYGYYEGYSHEKTALDALKREIEVSAQVAQANVQRIQAQQSSITQEVIKDYAQKLEQNRDYYRKHPRVIRLPNPTDSSGMPEISSSSCGIDQKTDGVAQNPSEHEDRTLDLEKAGEEVIQCEALIDWVKEQGRVQ